MKETANVREGVVISMGARGAIDDIISPEGHFGMVCTDAEGNVLWEEDFHNILPTVGANQILASGVTATANPYMGLISGASTPTLAVGDTMASHAGWLEADGTNAPNYGTSRPAITWGAPASSAVATGTQTYVFTNSGTVAGGFIVFGTGATVTAGNTLGVLMSEGTLATAQPVISGNTVTMTYTLTI